MFVHIIAERPSTLSELQALLGTQYRVSSALLDGDSSMPSECDAIVVAADLRRANNVAILRATSDDLKRAHRRIFIVDQKARLCAAQAYALNATHVLFNPVYQRNLVTALTNTAAPNEPSRDNQGAHQTALEGAALLASMFSVVTSGGQVDVIGARHFAGRITDTIAEVGLSDWLETVRRHHEGTYQHCLLVTGTAAAFGLNLGLARADMERLNSAAMFHDIGKAKYRSRCPTSPGVLTIGNERLSKPTRQLGMTHCKEHRGYLRKSWTPSDITTNIWTAADIPTASALPTYPTLFGS